MMGVDAGGSGPVTVISPQGVEVKKDFKDLYLNVWFRKHYNPRKILTKNIL